MLQKEDAIALSKGDCLPDGREIWIAKTGLRYYCVSVGCKKQTADAGLQWSYEGIGIKRENLS